MGNFNVEIKDLYQSVKHLQACGCVFQYYEDQEYNGRSFTINGKELLHFANCSYLGLEKEPALIEGAVQAVRQYGSQNSMSRAMLSSPLYASLEEKLGKVFPGFQSIYPTTTLTHCSALPLLIGPKDAIILDAYVHNSVRMASKICSANGTFSILSKHNDMNHVKYLIYRLKKEGYKNIWYCADGIYSIHGNFCDVEGLNQLLDEEENFYAYVDDAHGLGWYGENGAGYVVGSKGLHKKMVVVGSFAKSFAASGGVLIASEELLVDYLRVNGQTMIFSGPIQPAVLGSLNESLKLHLSNELPKLQSELTALIQHFRKKSIELNLPIYTKDESPIQLLTIGSMELTYKILTQLINQGFFSMAAGYPAIEKGEEGIRITITRHLSKKDITAFLESIKEIMEKEGVLPNS